MKRGVLFCMGIILLLAARAGAQDSYSDRAKKYIEQYASLAILEQQKNGIPAAITLGQGILETEAGASELMTEANNHFGIKCSNGWLGPTFSHTDDAPDECFKKYKCAEDSYRDHSEHLKRNPRYAPLFSLSETDYASWAVCLKKCGYATNPQYAQNLIKVIEDFKLQEYTYSALNGTALAKTAAVPSAPHSEVVLHDEPGDASDTGLVLDSLPEEKEPVVNTEPIKSIADSARDMMAHLAPAAAPQPVAEAPAITAANNYENSKLVTANGLKAFYAYKDEMLLQYAIKYNIHYPKLLEMNDLPDAPLAFNTYIYVEKKRASGTHSQHAVKEGETMLMVAQVEGMQLKKLRELNQLGPNEEPATGTILELQFPVRRKPGLHVVELPPQKNEARALANNAAVANADYIDVNSLNSKPLAEPVVTTKISQPTVIAPAQTNNKDIIEAAPAERHDSPISSQPQMHTVVYNEENKPVTKTTPAPKKEIPVAAKDKVSSKYYTVIKGDTAFSIAKRNDITLEELTTWNRIKGGIKIGQVLQVKE